MVETFSVEFTIRAKRFFMGYHFECLVSGELATFQQNFLQNSELFFGIPIVTRCLHMLKKALRNTVPKTFIIAIISIQIFFTNVMIESSLICLNHSSYCM